MFRQGLHLFTVQGQLDINWICPLRNVRGELEPPEVPGTQTLQTGRVLGIRRALLREGEPMVEVKQTA